MPKTVIRRKKVKYINNPVTNEPIIFPKYKRFLEIGRENRNLLDFLQKCWRNNNMFRPTAKELLSHKYLL